MANPTQHDDESKDLLPTAQAPQRPNTTARSFAIRAWTVGVLAVAFVSVWFYFASLLVEEKELGSWPDVPYTAERAKLLTLLFYFSLAAAILITAGAVFAVFSLLEAVHLRSAKANVPRGAKTLTAVAVIAIYAISLCVMIQPDETCEGMLQTIVHVPDTLALPVTATVFSPRSTCTGRSCARHFTLDDAGTDLGTLLQFALTGSELAITPEANSSLGVLYDFHRGSAVASFLLSNGSPAINSTAIFSNTKFAMSISLPSPWNKTVCIGLRASNSGRHPISNSSDAGNDTPTPGSVTIFRAVNKRKGRMCIAQFDRNNLDELAPLAFPLGLVMHAARQQTPRSVWRMMRQSPWF